MQITKMERTSTGFPAQWEGQLENGQYIYIRYRWGLFTLGIGDTIDDAVLNTIFRFETPHKTGVMSESTMMTIIETHTIYRFNGIKAKLLENEIHDIDVLGRAKEVLEKLEKILDEKSIEPEEVLKSNIAKEKINKNE